MSARTGIAAEPDGCGSIGRGPGKASVASTMRIPIASAAQAGRFGVRGVMDPLSRQAGAEEPSDAAPPRSCGPLAWRCEFSELRLRLERLPRRHRARAGARAHAQGPGERPELLPRLRRAPARPRARA